MDTVTSLVETIETAHRGYCDPAVSDEVATEHAIVWGEAMEALAAIPGTTEATRRAKARALKTAIVSNTGPRGTLIEGDFGLGDSLMADLQAAD